MWGLGELRKLRISNCALDGTPGNESTKLLSVISFSGECLLSVFLQTRWRQAFLAWWDESDWVTLDLGSRCENSLFFFYQNTQSNTAKGAGIELLKDAITCLWAHSWGPSPLHAQLQVPTCPSQFLTWKSLPRLSGRVTESVATSPTLPCVVHFHNNSMHCCLLRIYYELKVHFIHTMRQVQVS